MSIGARIYAELRGDKVIWMIVGLLTMFSLLIVYSSTGTLAYRERGGDTEFFLLKQITVLGLGLFMAYMAYIMHYMKYNKVAPYLLVIAVPLLVYTIAFGTDINDAKRWIMLPFVGITFQTSDFAKLALIIYVAREITKKQEYIKDFQSAFLPIIVPVLIICGLIAPADLSTSLMLFLTCITMMYVGRVALKYIFLLLLLGVVVFSFLILLGNFFPKEIRVDTWTSRVEEFLNEDSGGFQVQQAKIAIANGGVIGRGPGNSLQRNHLPSAYSDFIYSIICEEYGLIGGFIVLFLYVLLMFRTVRLVTISPKAFGAMLAIGLTVSLVTQALANISVNVHLVPVTGLTLPFLSMGGTSLLFSCLALGMILSVSKHIEQLKQQQDQKFAGTE
ncbi:MAG TPA: FtsW/RodA/SpoVE family cell cycle protein [Saprospiraceae bacterium]|nr:FtsW/RodA/SpoVE family cell cycle protein [Saprospiraceae bacterium]